MELLTSELAYQTRHPPPGESSPAETPDIVIHEGSAASERTGEIKYESITEILFMLVIDCLGSGKQTWSSFIAFAQVAKKPRPVSTYPSPVKIYQQRRRHSHLPTPPVTPAQRLTA